MRLKLVITQRYYRLTLPLSARQYRCSSSILPDVSLEHTFSLSRPAQLVLSSLASGLDYCHLNNIVSNYKNTEGQQNYMRAKFMCVNCMQGR